MTFKLRFLLQSLGIIGFFFSSLPAFAQGVRFERGDTLKAIAGQSTIFEVASLSGAHLEQLQAWLASSSSERRVRASGSEIVGAPVPLVVTPEIASRWQSDPQDLARLFASRLQEQLGTGAPNWGTSLQVVPLSENREIRLSNASGLGSLDVYLDSPEVAKVDTLGEGRFRITGLAPGKTQLRVVAGSGRTVPSLPIEVKPWAARWGSGPGSLKLHGPVDSARVERIVRRWLSARTLLGAKVSVSSKPSKEANQHRFLATASAPGALPVELDFQVSIQGLPASQLPPARALVLSNHPERIVDDGVLFERQVAVTPFRFMWHHRNDPEGPERFLVLELSNPVAQDREVELLWSSYGPSPDEIHVGHTAGLEFVKQSNQGRTERLTLPASGSRTVEIRNVKPGQTMSGLVYLRDLGPGSSPVGVKVLAAQAGMGLPQSKVESRDRGRTASGVFPAEVSTRASHTLGGPFTFIEYGGEPYVRDFDGDHPSYGNFGTVYRTVLTLFNPSDDYRDAFLGFSAPGGAARGILVVDDTIYDLPMGRSGDGVPVTSYNLAPGETRTVRLELFPQAGSNYPVRLVVRSNFERREKVEVEDETVFGPFIP